MSAPADSTPADSLSAEEGFLVEDEPRSSRYNIPMVHLGTGKDGWRRYYCTVCGHIEWVAPGEELPAHYRCPLCEAQRSVMLALDDPRLRRHGVTFKQIHPAVWQIAKRPPFRADFNHYAYLLAHPDGVILYDAPPLVTDDAVAEIRSAGRPRLLVVSHQDFVGMAGDWGQVLGIPVWMGAGDEAIPGNRLIPDERIDAPRRLSQGLEVVPVPGHSPGSLALYWSSAPGGPVLCAGDAVTVWHHPDGRIQLAYFQSPPAGREIIALTSRPVALLCTCGGALAHADSLLRVLREASESCARPWRGDPGGIWLDATHASVQALDAR